MKFRNLVHFVKKERFSKESIKRTKKFEDHTGMVLFILRDNPMTFEQIISEFEKMELNLAFSYRDFFEPKRNRRSKKRRKTIERDLDSLEESGHVRKIAQDNKYKITELGKNDLKTFDSTVNRIRKSINKILNPKYSPVGSLVVHVIIGALKLTGFFITGSVGLLADGIDSSIDAISSVVVSIAMKYKKEIQATYLLIGLMTVSGITIIYESTTSLLSPEPLSNGIFGIVVTSISIVLCFFLFMYQRVVGYFKRNLAVLTQAVDSKNHIILGFLVLAGVIFGYYNLSIVDSIVGILIGLLILKGSYELLQDIRAASRGEEVDYEKYKLGFLKRMEFSQKQLLRFWVLWKVDTGYNNREKLLVEFENTFSSKLDDFLHLEIERKTEDEKIEKEKISASKQITDLNLAIKEL